MTMQNRTSNKGKKQEGCVCIAVLAIFLFLANKLGRVEGGGGQGAGSREQGKMGWKGWLLLHCYPFFPSL